MTFLIASTQKYSTIAFYLKATFYTLLCSSLTYFLFFYKNEEILEHIVFTSSLKKTTGEYRTAFLRSLVKESKFNLENKKLSKRDKIKNRLEQIQAIFKGKNEENAYTDVFVIIKLKIGDTVCHLEVKLEEEDNLNEINLHGIYSKEQVKEFISIIYQAKAQEGELDIFDLNSNLALRFPKILNSLEKFIDCSEIQNYEVIRLNFIKNKDYSYAITKTNKIKYDLIHLAKYFQKNYAINTYTFTKAVSWKKQPIRNCIIFYNNIITFIYILSDFIFLVIAYTRIISKEFFNLLFYNSQLTDSKKTFLLIIMENFEHEILKSLLQYRGIFSKYIKIIIMIFSNNIKFVVNNYWVFSKIFFKFSNNIRAVIYVYARQIELFEILNVPAYKLYNLTNNFLKFYEGSEQIVLETSHNSANLFNAYYYNKELAENALKNLRLYSNLSTDSYNNIDLDPIIFNLGIKFSRELSAKDLFLVFLRDIFNRTLATRNIVLNSVSIINIKRSIYQFFFFAVYYNIIIRHYILFIGKAYLEALIKYNLNDKNRDKFGLKYYNKMVLEVVDFTLFYCSDFLTLFFIIFGIYSHVFAILAFNFLVFKNSHIIIFYYIKHVIATLIDWPHSLEFGLKLVVKIKNLILYYLGLINSPDITGLIEDIHNVFLLILLIGLPLITFPKLKIVKFFEFASLKIIRTIIWTNFKIMNHNFMQSKFNRFNFIFYVSHVILGYRSGNLQKIIQSVFQHYQVFNTLFLLIFSWAYFSICANNTLSISDLISLENFIFKFAKINTLPTINKFASQFKISNKPLSTENILDKFYLNVDPISIDNINVGLGLGLVDYAPFNSSLRQKTKLILSKKQLPFEITIDDRIIEDTSDEIPTDQKLGLPLNSLLEFVDSKLTILDSELDALFDSLSGEMNYNEKKIISTNLTLWHLKLEELSLKIKELSNRDISALELLKNNKLSFKSHPLIDTNIFNNEYKASITRDILKRNLQNLKTELRLIEFLNESSLNNREFYENENIIIPHIQAKTFINNPFFVKNFNLKDSDSQKMEKASVHFKNEFIIKKVYLSIYKKIIQNKINPFMKLLIFQKDKFFDANINRKILSGEYNLLDMDMDLLALNFYNYMDILVNCYIYSFFKDSYFCNIFELISRLLNFLFSSIEQANFAALTTLKSQNSEETCNTIFFEDYSYKTSSRPSSRINLNLIILFFESYILFEIFLVSLDLTFIDLLHLFIKKPEIQQKLKNICNIFTKILIKVSNNLLEFYLGIILKITFMPYTLFTCIAPKSLIILFEKFFFKALYRSNSFLISKLKCFLENISDKNEIIKALLNYIFYFLRIPIIQNIIYASLLTAFLEKVLKKRFQTILKNLCILFEKFGFVINFLSKIITWFNYSIFNFEKFTKTFALLLCVDSQSIELIIHLLHELNFLNNSFSINSICIFIILLVFLHNLCEIINILEKTEINIISNFSFSKIISIFIQSFFRINGVLPTSFNNFIYFSLYFAKSSFRALYVALFGLTENSFISSFIFDFEKKNHNELITLIEKIKGLIIKLKNLKFTLLQTQVTDDLEENIVSELEYFKEKIKEIKSNKIFEERVNRSWTELNTSIVTLNRRTSIERIDNFILVLEEILDEYEFKFSSNRAAIFSAYFSEINNILSKVIEIIFATKIYSASALAILDVYNQNQSISKFSSIINPMLRILKICLEVMNFFTGKILAKIVKTTNNYVIKILYFLIILSILYIYDTSSYEIFETDHMTKILRGLCFESLFKFILLLIFLGISINYLNFFEKNSLDLLVKYFINRGFKIVYFFANIACEINMTNISNNFIQIANYIMFAIALREFLNFFLILFLTNFKKLYFLISIIIFSISNAYLIFIAHPEKLNKFLIKNYSRVVVCNIKSNPLVILMLNKMGFVYLFVLEQYTKKSQENLKIPRNIFCLICYTLIKAYYIFILAYIYSLFYLLFNLIYDLINITVLISSKIFYVYDVENQTPSSISYIDYYYLIFLNVFMRLYCLLVKKFNYNIFNENKLKLILNSQEKNLKIVLNKRDLKLN